MKCFTAFLVLILALTTFAADPLAPAVDVHRRDGRQLTTEQRARIATWTVNLLATANFSTVAHPDLLRQTVGQLQDSYRRTLAADYVVVTYDRAVVVPTRNGDVVLREIIVGLNRADEFPSALYSIDAEGRLVEYTKYGGPMPVELRPGPATQPATQPASAQTRATLFRTDFRWLRPDMSIAEVYSQLGQPARDIGTDIQILEYVLVGGDRVYIGSDGRKMLYARYGSIDGADMIRAGDGE